MPFAIRRKAGLPDGFKSVVRRRAPRRIEKRSFASSALYPQLRKIDQMVDHAQALARVEPGR
jgi:hypothetical protein